MISLPKYMIIVLTMFTCFTIGCESNQPTAVKVERQSIHQSDSILISEKENIIAFIEKVLVAAGNYDITSLDDMTSDKAMLGISSFRNGVWTNAEITINEYFESINARESSPYFEIANDFDIIVTEGRLALVRADAILHRYGIPQTREINHFTLLKDNDQWKLLNIAFTVSQLPDEKRNSI